MFRERPRPPSLGLERTVGLFGSEVVVASGNGPGPVDWRCTSEPTSRLPSVSAAATMFSAARSTCNVSVFRGTGISWPPRRLRWAWKTLTILFDVELRFATVLGLVLAQNTHSVDLPGGQEVWRSCDFSCAVRTKTTARCLLAGWRILN